MTQRERIHSMLKAAGRSGVRSDQFFTAHMPRAAARIQELKDSGVEIETEREGKYVRYRIAGVGAGSASGVSRAGVPWDASVDSGESPEQPPAAASSGTTRLFELAEPEKLTVPSAYDPYSEAA